MLDCIAWCILATLDPRSHSRGNLCGRVNVSNAIAESPE